MWAPPLVASLMAPLVASFITLAPGLSSAQGTALPYTQVAQALAALRAADGQGTIVTESEGWVTVNQPLASAQWSFVPSEHAAYPAVIRRIIRRGPGGAVNVETDSLCEGPRPACEQLLVEFAALNSRITQAVKAQGRQGSNQAKDALK